MIEQKVISGIHNYCNRWCERCEFTMRCEVGLHEVKRKEKTLSEEDIWDEVRVNLEKAFELLRKMLEEMEDELETTDVPKDEEKKILSKDSKEEESTPKLNQLHQDIKDNSKQYGFDLNDWFSDYATLFEEKEQELKQLLKVGAKDVIKEASLLREAIKVVQWNMFLIGAKLNRAVSGLYPSYHFDKENPVQNDSNGSAKVALIAIEDSLGAWNIIREKIPELSDELLDILVKLDRLRKKSMEAFPYAQKFIRPGFDE